MMNGKQLFEERKRHFLPQIPPPVNEMPTGEMGIPNNAQVTPLISKTNLTIDTPCVSTDAPRGERSKQSDTSPPGDVITVLRASKRLVKTWGADGSIKPYDNAKNYCVEEHQVSDIRELSKLLKELESDRHACIVRGKFIGFEKTREIEPLDHPDKTFRRDHLFEDQPLHSVLIEVDDYEPGAHETVRDPVAAIDEYIKVCLPAEFQEVSYHWQLSNSAGHPSKQGFLKVHLWFWLRTPCTSSQLRAWAEAIDLKADRSVFQKIQVHYTGAPVFDEGVTNPVTVRSSFVAFDDNEVDLKIDVSAQFAKPEPVTRAKKIKQAQSNDPITQVLIDSGMVKNNGTDGRLNIVCPFESSHTGEGAESATTYFPAFTGGFEKGAFKCLHAHCANRAQGEYFDALGISTGSTADEFPVEMQPTGGGMAQGRLIDIGDLLAKKFAPLNWVVPKVLPEGLFLLVSAPKIGKSWLAIQMVLAVAAGGEVLGQRVPAGDALYLALEDNERRLQDRLRLLGADTAVRVGRAQFAVEWPLSNAGGTDAIDDWLTKHPGARLVVVDVLERFRPRRRAKGNMYEEDYAAISALKQLSDKHRVAILVVHHTRKGASDDPFATVSGTQALTGGADGTLILEKGRGESRGKLHLTGRDIKDDGEFVVEFENCRWEMIGGAGEVASTFDRQEILNALRAVEEPLSAAEVAVATGRERTATSHLLKKMVRDGVVSKEGSKYWPAAWEDLSDHGGGENDDDLA